MLKKINSLFVTMFGIGKLPRIPGSYASLVTVILKEEFQDFTDNKAFFAIKMELNSKLNSDIQEKNVESNVANNVEHSIKRI